jgi:hypothetical protein
MIAIALALFMVVPMLFAAGPVSAAGNATLSLVPSTNINLTYPNTLPSTFTVQVNIQNGQTVWGVNAMLAWNPAVVRETACVKGTYLSSVDSDASPAPVVDQTAGTVTFSDVLLSTASANGDGTLFTVTFQTIGFGSGSISLAMVKLLDPSTSHVELPIDTVIPLSIPLSNPTPPPQPPHAAYTISVAAPSTLNGQYIKIPSSASSAAITLDATSSTGGFDGSVTVPITAYSWTIHSVGAKFADMHPTTATVSLMNIVADDLVISLTVTATGAVPPTNTIGPVTYHVLQAAASGVDVQTQNGGSGPGAAGGYFGPQQNIVATATVIFNGAPVASKLVNFEIYDNAGNAFGFLTASTNGQGIASVNFRLPTIDTGVEQGFGSNWRIVATVDVSEVQYVDTCAFTFTYLVNIGTPVTTTPASVVRGTGTVTINSVITSVVPLTGVQVTFTVVDSNNVPIACSIAQPAITAGNNNVATGGLHIPNYAFTGQAKIYVNALTALGLPYCPQNGEVITYDASGHFTGATQNQPAQFSITI